MLNSVCCIAAEGFVHILLTIEEDLFSFSAIDFDRDCQHQSLDGTKEDLKWIPIAVVCVVSWWWPSDGPSPTSLMVSSS